VSFAPIRPDDGEWPPSNPEFSKPTESVSIPDGSITDAKIAGGISPLKLAQVVIKVSLSGAQTVTTSTDEVVEYDTTDLNQGYAAMASNVITLPYAGMYLCSVRGQWASDGTGRRRLTIQLNSTDTDIQDHQHIGGTVTHVSGTTGLLVGSAGGLLRARCFQTSGGNLTLDSSQLSVIFLGPV
jgi:hypothetical protein